MNINNIAFTQFHASVVSFDAKVLGINNNIMLPEIGYYPYMRDQKLTAQERSLVIDFIAEDDISDFTAECMQESILNLDDGYEYVCFLKAAPEIQTEGVCSFTATYPMYVIKRKPMVQVLINGEITIQGNIWSNCILEIKSTKNLTQLILDEYIVKNLKANDTFVIDGIHKLIYRKSNPNISAFDDTNVINFPRVDPGKHDYLISDNTVQVTLKYYPTYL